MAQLFRGMRETDRGLPEVGPSARTLGIRPGIDVSSMKPDDLVFPNQGGMSVSPSDPWNLPEHRRPPEFHGVGRDPVWNIDETQLGPNLMYRPDPHQPGHGFVEPARSMTLAEYQDALAQTQASWCKVESWPDQGIASDAT